MGRARAGAAGEAAGKVGARGGGARRGGGGDGGRRALLLGPVVDLVAVAFGGLVAGCVTKP